MDKLVEAMEKLRQDLFFAGRDVGFTGDMVDVINHAVSIHLCGRYCDYVIFMSSCV
jgi:hypothetical protein